MNNLLMRVHVNTGTTGNRMFVPALRTLVLASSWALEASGNDAPSDARSLGRDNLDLTAWRDVAKRCLNDSWGSPSPVRRRDGKSAVEAVTGPRLLGNGHLQFTLLASSAGNTYTAWVRQEAPGAAEYAYQAATSGSAAEDFSWKHWRMTDARVRLFDVFAMHEMAAAGIPVLRGFYWPGKVWPKTAWQASPRRKHDLVGGQEWWPNRPASFEDRGTDSRHFAREVDLAPIGNDLFFRA